MAKKNDTSVKLIANGEVGMVPVGELATVWEVPNRQLPDGRMLYEFNSTRGSKLDSTAINATTQMLALHPTGWDSAFNAQVMTVLPEDCPFDLSFDDVLESRRAEWERLKQADALDEKTAADQLRVFTRMYLDENGELIQPKYWVNSGVTRTYCLRGANNVRRQFGKELILRIPCKVENFPKEVDRILANVRENTIAKMGDNPIGEKGLWRAAKELYRNGWKQSDFRFATNEKKDKTTDAPKLFGSKGQAFFYMLELDADFPEARIVHRFGLPKDDADSLNFAKFSIEAASALYKERTSIDLDGLKRRLLEVNTGENGKAKKATWDQMSRVARAENNLTRFVHNKFENGEVDDAVSVAIGTRDVCNVALREYQGGTYPRLREYVLAYEMAIKNGNLPALLAAVDAVVHTAS